MSNKLNKKENDFLYLHDEIANCADNIREIMDKTLSYIDEEKDNKQELLDIYMSLGYAVQDLYYINNYFTSKFGIPSAKESMKKEAYNSWDQIIHEMESVEHSHSKVKILSDKKKN